MSLLADAAPTGVGLVIVGVILLAFLAIAIAGVIAMFKLGRRRLQGRARPDASTQEDL